MTECSFCGRVGCGDGRACGEAIYNAKYAAKYPCSESATTERRAKLLRITEAKPFSGHRIGLKFSDGSAGVADLSDLVKEEPFLPIADHAVFSAWRLEDGTIEWPNVRLGIASEALHALAHGLKIPKTHLDVQDNEESVLLQSSGGKLLEVALAAKRLLVASDACDTEAARARADGTSVSSAPMVRYLNCREALRRALNLPDDEMPTDDPTPEKTP